MIELKAHDTDEARLNEAALWRARLNNPTCKQESWHGFVAWLESDSANSLAFDRVEDLYRSLDEAGDFRPLVGQPEMVAGWRSRAAGRLFPTKVVVAGAALLAASVAIAFIVNRSEPPSSSRYATMIGKTAAVSLTDSSVVDLNTNSVIVVGYGRTERRVSLDQGEAIFRVAKDPSRPFLVTVGNHEIRDTGTVFDVLRGERRIVITVAEGRVTVSPRSSAVSGHDDPVELAAGDQLIIDEDAGRSVVSHHIDPVASMTWWLGYMAYKDAPLSVVVSDLNRYFPTPIVLAGPDTGRYRFSGILVIDKQETIVRRLSEVLPLAIGRDDHGRILLRLKPHEE